MFEKLSEKIFKNKSELQYDFLPSDLEIIEKPASPVGKLIIYIIAVFIFSMIIISYVAKIDEIVVTSGQVVPVDGIKTIDSNLNGKIIKINKTEGDTVKEGEDILEIENLDSTKKDNEMKEEIELYKLQLDIVNYKIEGGFDEQVYTRYNIDPNKIEKIKLEEKIEQDSLTKDNGDYIKTLQEIDKKMQTYNTEITELQKEYENMSDVDKFISGKYKLNTINSKKEELPQLEQTKKNEVQSKETNNNQRKLKYIDQRNTIIESKKKLEDNMESIGNQNANYIVKSPIDGVILKLNYNTINSYVNQSKAIAEIVPNSSEYEIEAYIPNKDISRLKDGQEVVIKLDSYDYQKYGTLKGNISYTSPNSFNDEKKGLVYKVKVKFDKTENEDVKVLPGMGVTLEIKSDEIRLIEYFLDPFKKNIDNALKG